LAEGQPRNILSAKLNRFAGRCRVLSRRCHRVIHSCYAFEATFIGFFRAADLLQPLATIPTRGVRVNDASTRSALAFINSKPWAARWRIAVRLR
jgi:hypothetical protein